MRINRNTAHRVVAAALGLTVGMSLASCAGDAGGGTGSQGITDSEITIGITNPLSGPNAAYGAQGKAAQAYFENVNANGGVKMGDGKTRKIKTIMVDDAMEPARNLQGARKLVSQDNVFAVVASPGTGANMGSRAYYAQQEIPQVYVGSGGPDFDSPEGIAEYPYTFAGLPAYNTEAAIFAQYIHDNYPNAKIALLNDDSGGPYFADGFEKSAAKLGLNIVTHADYENAAPNVDSKIDKFAESGADLFVDASTPKFGVQILKRMNAINWKPIHIMWGVGSSIGGVFEPAGLELATGVISSHWLKDAMDPQYADDKDVAQFKEVLQKYGDQLDPADTNAASGYAAASAFVQNLEAMKEPTQKALMDVIRHMDKVKPAMVLPGVPFTTNGKDDGYPVESLQIVQFDGTKFNNLGDVIDYEGKTPKV